MTRLEEKKKIRLHIVAGMRAVKSGNVQLAVGQYGMAMYLLGRSRFDISADDGFQVFHQIGDLEAVISKKLK